MKTPTVQTLSLKNNILISGLILLVFIGLIGTWANMAPLESASIAPGFIRAQGQNKSVEHLYGGKVNSIAVKNSDRVEAGDIVLTLDCKESEIALQATRHEYMILLAERDKALTLLNMRDHIVFSNETLALAEKMNNRRILDIQIEHLSATRTVRKNNEHVLLAKREQIHSSIVSEQQKLIAQEKQLKLSHMQLDSYNTLKNANHIARLKVLDLEKEIAQLEVTINTNKGLLQEKQLELKENAILSQQLVSEEKQQAAIVLAKIEDSIPATLAKLSRLQNIIDESVIRAPVSGKVTELKVSSIGETIKPGEQLMHILPENDRLIVEARLNTTDIESITQGQQARVRLSAYNMRDTAMLKARIEKISADRMEDELGYFYAIELKIDRSDLKKYPELTLMAGMPAESIIINNKRTLMDYLLEPIKRGINRSLRES